MSADWEKLAGDYWDALTWSGRIKSLRALELQHSLFKREWKDLPDLVQHRLMVRWRTEMEDENGSSHSAGQRRG